MNYIDKLKFSKDLVTPGMSACQGCGGELCLRRVLQIAGENSVIAIHQDVWQVLVWLVEF